MGNCQVLPPAVQLVIVPSEALLQAWGDQGIPVQSPAETYGQSLLPSEEPFWHMRAWNMSDA